MVTAPIRRYRWMRLLRSCDFDPERLETPLQEPGNDDFIICGCPRSGTSLLAAALFQPPESVVSMEPWDGLRMEPAALFASLRSEIEDDGVLRRGRLDISALQQEGRVAWVRDGERLATVEVESRFRLGVKWPAFWRYLDRLPNTRFLVCVRDPVEVVASMRRTGGRLADGYDYDVAFNRVMNTYLRDATSDPAIRTALLYEYVNSRVVPHVDDSNVLVVHYERWLEEPKELLSEVAHFLGLKNIELNIRPYSSAREEPRGEVDSLVRRFSPSAEQFGYPLP